MCSHLYKQYQFKFRKQYSKNKTTPKNKPIRAFPTTFNIHIKRCNSNEMQTYKVGAELISAFLDQILCSSLYGVACEMNAYKSKPQENQKDHGSSILRPRSWLQDWPHVDVELRASHITHCFQSPHL